MGNINDYLQQIISARFGKDVRQAIHDGIEQCYEDGKAGVVDREARAAIDSIEPELATATTDISNIKASLSNQIDMGFLGKNLLGVYDFSVKNQLDASGGVKYITLSVKANTPYTCSIDKSSTTTENLADVFIAKSGMFSTANNGVFKNSPRTETSTSDGKICVGIRSSVVNDFINGVFHIQVEEGSTATTYVKHAPSNFEITDIKKDLNGVTEPQSLIASDIILGKTYNFQTNASRAISKAYKVNGKGVVVKVNNLGNIKYSVSGYKSASETSSEWVKELTTGGWINDTNSRYYDIPDGINYIRLTFCNSSNGEIVPSDIASVSFSVDCTVVCDVKNTLSGYETISKGLGDIKDTTFDLPIGPNEIKTYLIVCQHQGGANRLVCLLTLSFDNNVYRPTITKLLDNANWTIAYANGVLTITNSTATRYSLYSVKRLM